MARILVADDASFMRQIIRDILESEGHEIVAEASDGIQAVEEWKKHRPDLVTMDIVMPRRSGIDAVRAIAALDATARIVRDVRPLCAGVHLMTLGWEEHIPRILRAGGVR